MADEFTRIGATARRLAREHGPRLLSQLMRSGPVQAGRQALAAAVAEAVGAEPTQDAKPKEFTPGRPVTRTSQPSELRARAIAYAPALDGRADPGEIVWTWVEFEETGGPEAGQGKDRPVLVVGRSGETLLGLMLSTRDHGGDDRWMELGSGAWDDQRRPSWIRLDRVLDVPEDGIRREGAILELARFDLVARRLRTEYGWH
ncbi:type II toxin-antitoxin system PemK/MazF family toxin [Tsukamurella sp. 8F]|uniref:type II toxin-antitoxin system PemK/MazF family toxin n=1 Tax=unclassified Tsukamurella TaxID=2633480 RepID=UPI0023B8E725|nr:MULTISPECIES: type II toxin-antitoxin system PemK/MazF family toxin [unclassified Tsukamurella]MDF0532256.1 type II toxin-antitoxin system PemK/MazF family toxin [Tsukamurella sp. 8J]MDF0589490.1 type II toxin-antitoxin system PemK/MazF family toxin [Tsukamurella sp. 8F]